MYTNHSRGGPAIALLGHDANRSSIISLRADMAGASAVLDNGLVKVTSSPGGDSLVFGGAAL